MTLQFKGELALKLRTAFKSRGSEVLAKCKELKLLRHGYSLLLVKQIKEHLLAGQPIQSYETNLDLHPIRPWRNRGQQQATDHAPLISAPQGQLGESPHFKSSLFHTLIFQGYRQGTTTQSASKFCSSKGQKARFSCSAHLPSLCFQVFATWPTYYRFHPLLLLLPTSRIGYWTRVLHSNLTLSTHMINPPLFQRPT